MRKAKFKKSGKRIVLNALMLSLATGIVYTTLLDTAEAQRRTLLEQWFEKAAENNRKRQLKRLRKQRPDLFAIERAPEKKPAPKIKKVSGPQYYNYKTEALTTLSMAGAMPAVVTESIQPEVSGIEAPAGIPPAISGFEGSQSDNLDLAKTGAIGQFAPRMTETAVRGWSMTVEKGIAKALKAHYSNHPDYLWVGADMRPNDRAADLIAALARAENFGLDSEDYVVEFPAISSDRKVAESTAAQFELSLSAAAMRYAQDAKVGRINPNRLSGYHDFPKYKRHYGSQFAKLIDAEAPGVVLESQHPSNSVFAGLMTELAELRDAADRQAIEPIKAGTFIKPGQSHDELPKIIELIKRSASDELLAKHAITFTTYDQRLVMDKPLEDIIRDFQSEKGLGPDGIVGKRTIAKIQVVSPKWKIAKIELAMERLRWHPHNLGARYVMINQPAYRVNYMVNDKSQLAMNVVVGKKSNQTYFFHDTIELVEVNPYWNVPRSILVNEMLGKIQSDPGYLSARNYEVVSYKGQPKDPYNINWHSADGFKGVYVRQKPGSGNALGELKILFPNKHAIYMHDTPAKKLFSRSKRAYSHGCVRLADPRAMAAAVLGTSKKQIGSYIAAGQNKAIKVQNKLPVYVAYFTAWADENGKVSYYSDVYGRDDALTKALAKTRKLRESGGVKLAS